MTTADTSSCVLAFCVAIGSLVSQHPIPDLILPYGKSSYQRTDSSAGSVYGRLSSSELDGTGVAKLHWVEFLSTGPEVAPAVAYEVPGMNRITSVQWLAPDRVLVAGAFDQQGTGSGKVAELVLSYSSRTIQVVSSVDLGPLVPASLVYHPSEAIVYLLDGVTGSVLVAPWAGPGAALPATFLTVALSADTPPVEFRLQVEEAGGVRTAVRNIFQNRSLADGGALPPEKRVWFDGMGWHCEVVQPPPSAPSAPYWVLEQTSPVHTAPLLVSLTDATATGAFELRVRSTGQLLATGVVSTPGQKVAVPAPGEFEMTPGLQCYVVDAAPNISGILPSNDLVQVVRYGRAFSVGGTSLKSYRAILPPTDAVIGSQDFGFTCSFDVAAPARSPASLLAGVLVGVRGVDEVTVVGDLAVLTPAFSVILPQSVEGERLQFGARIPIPNDPQLDGVVVIGQVAALAADGTLAFSDVVGTTIRSPFGGMALLSAPAGAQRASSSTPAERRAAGRSAWAESARSREGRPGRGVGWVQRALQLLRER